MTGFYMMGTLVVKGLIKLFLTNLREMKIPISFSLILSLFLSHTHNLFLKKATLISSSGTGRHLQLTSVATLHRNRMS